MAFLVLRKCDSTEQTKSNVAPAKMDTTMGDRIYLDARNKHLLSERDQGKKTKRSGRLGTGAVLKRESDVEDLKLLFFMFTFFFVYIMALGSGSKIVA